MSTENDNAERSEVLSREETDALLKGIEDGSVPTGGDHGRPSGEVTLYDFAGCDRLTRGAMPTLTIVNERVARLLAKSLTTLLRRPIEVSASPNRLERFEEFLPTLPFPACLNLVQLRPLPGRALIIPAQPLIYTSVDCFFGGRGTLPDDQPARELTKVEARIVSMLLERVFDALTEAWRPVYALTPELTGQEQNPHFARIAGKRDPVLVTEFSVRHDDQEATLQLVTPQATLAPIEQLLDSTPRSDETEHDDGWTKALVEQLAEAALDLRATLTETTLRIGDVLSLQTGDVIPVELPEKITLQSGDVALFEGRAGASRNRNAIAISKQAETGAAKPKTKRTTNERRTYDSRPGRGLTATG